jgi:hypothetical protein
MSAAASNPAPRRRLAPIEAIVAGLAARAPELARELLPGGYRDGQEWRVGSLAGERGHSLAVHLGGGKAGVWADFSSGECGDALDLVAQARFRGDKRAALGWARSWLGLDGGDPERFRRLQAAERQRAETAETELAAKRAVAFRLWLSARPSLAGTPAEAYLRGRGIALGDGPGALGRQPRALRFHPELWHKPSGRCWPALLAAIVDAEGKFLALHRTWLAPDGGGKAPVEEPKRTLGRYAGGLIRLWRGSAGTEWKRAAAGETLVISEGIEDGLSCALAMPEWRVAAAVSLSNLGAVILPPAIARVVVAAQNDAWWSDAAAGGAGDRHGAARGLDRALRHLCRQGKQVAVARSSVGKDLNDMLRGTG